MALSPSSTCRRQPGVAGGPPSSLTFRGLSQSDAGSGAAVRSSLPARPYVASSDGGATAAPQPSLGASQATMASIDQLLPQQPSQPQLLSGASAGGATTTAAATAPSQVRGFGSEVAASLAASAGAYLPALHGVQRSSSLLDAYPPGGGAASRVATYQQQQQPQGGNLVLERSLYASTTSLPAPQASETPAVARKGRGRGERDVRGGGNGDGSSGGSSGGGATPARSDTPLLGSVLPEAQRARCVAPVP